LIREKVLVRKDKSVLYHEEGEVVKRKVGEKEDVLGLPWLHNELPFVREPVLGHHLFLHERR
jgi:hypothetical protein